MDELTPLLPDEPWARRRDEREMEYAWFCDYADTLGERDVLRTARKLGQPVRLLREAASRHQWDERARVFDEVRRSVTASVIIDEDEALQLQYAVGIAMMRLGIKAVQLKNPALIRMKDIQALMERGAEMARRGAGVADLKIEKTVQQRVESEFRDLLGED